MYRIFCKHIGLHTGLWMLFSINEHAPHFLKICRVKNPNLFMYRIFCKTVGLHTGLWLLFYLNGHAPHFLKSHRVRDSMYRIYWKHIRGGFEKLHFQRQYWPCTIICLYREIRKSRRLLQVYRKTLIYLCTAFSANWLGYIQGYASYLVLKGMHRIFWKHIGLKTLICLCTAFSANLLGYIQGYRCYFVLIDMHRIFWKLIGLENLTQKTLGNWTERATQKKKKRQCWMKPRVTIKK